LRRCAALNLILTFTVAVIGYWFGLLRDDKFLPSAPAKCSLLISGLLLAVTALAAALWTTFGSKVIQLRRVSRRRPSTAVKELFGAILSGSPPTRREPGIAAALGE